MALHDYLQATQRLLREQNQPFENVEDLLSYVNNARREIALRTQCVRILTPSSGVITGYEIINPGSGYSVVSPPVVTVTAPDFPSGMLPTPNGQQATANATVAADGTISSILPNVGGAGYFQPTVAISSPVSGVTATARVIVQGITLLNQGQEVYPFSGIDLGANPGCKSVYAVRGISIIYSGYRYSIESMAFTKYQTYRAFPYQFQHTPAICSQRAQGTSGDFYFYPLPAQSIQAEWDCQCLPSDLTLDNQTPDVIPDPWTDAVPYMAAHLAYLELQNFNAAKFMLDLYEKRALSYSQFTRIGRASNQYGRPLR